MTWDTLHDEDILFEFRGTEPTELTVGRFYRGTVDGFADFGVFVRIGESVTGLLHRSKLDRRLESLDWDSGESVIVQVEDVQDNGNVDLAWSIRQSSTEFRAESVDDPTAASTDDTTGSEGVGADVVETNGDPERQTGVGTKAIAEARSDALADRVGDRVRIEGRIADIRQTSGPTVFAVSDRAGTVECAAFESAGERAYPTLEVDDLVRVVGVVQRHRGAIQIEAEGIERLAGSERESVQAAIEREARKRAEPDDVSVLIPDPAIDSLADDMATVATSLREAVLDDQPIVVRHPTAVDGVIAGAAIERALRVAYREEFDEDADPSHVYRRPMRDTWYTLGDAMFDLGAGEEGESPILVLVGAGASSMDRPALDFLGLYDVARFVIDAFDDPIAVDEVTDGATIGEAGIRVTTIAVNIAGMVTSDLRDELRALPALSYGTSAPAPYRDAAAEHGIDAETIEERHQALVLFGYYQRFDDKRELIADLLFDGDEAEQLAAHVSAQYRERVETAVEIARSHGRRQETAGPTLFILDGESFTHRFDFPPREVLAEELLTEDPDRAVEIVAIIGLDECYLAPVGEIDLSRLGSSLNEAVPDASVEATRDRITFLAGKRAEIRTALPELVANQLG